MEISWQMLHEQIASCEKCRLCQTRQHTVPGEGNPKSRILFVGEGPGAREDEQGRPFVGPAGQLLDRMLAAIGLDRESVYIANVVKCRPPNNRVPEPDEVAACLPYLRMQTGLLQPRILVCLGATAARAIIDPNFRITRERGVWQERKGVWIMATYHPSALLRDPAKKKEAWQDMQAIQAKLSALCAEDGYEEG